MKPPRFISMSGLIGVGKSSFTKDLSKFLKFDPVYEPVEDNKYLPLFYENPKRWAYPMQEHLKSMRFRLHQAAVWNISCGISPGVVADRDIYQDSIFAKINNKLGNITDIELETYLLGLSDMVKYLAEPDVIIHLEASPETCKRRADNRGRDVETNTNLRTEQDAEGIPLSYLRILHEGYEEWLAEMDGRIPVIRVDWEEFRPVEEVWDGVLKKLEARTHYNRCIRI